MSRETAIVFNDGSLESKVLQFELKTSYDIQVIDVPKYSNLQEWVEKAIEYTENTIKGILKIILHFPIEDYIQKDIRTEMMEIQRKNPNLRIIAWYEQAPRTNIANRAANYGIKQDTFKAVKQTEVASDKVTPYPKGKEDLSDEFVKKLEESHTTVKLSEPTQDIKDIASDIRKDIGDKKKRRKFGI